MNVSHNSFDKLILDHTPWVLGGIFAALIVISAGATLYFVATKETVGALVSLGGMVFAAIFFVAFIRRVQLVLDRPGATATLRRRDLIRTTQVQFVLDQVRRAEVQVTTSPGDGNSGPTETSRATLVVDTHPKPVPLTLVYSSGSGADRAAKAINTWLGA